MIPLLSQLFSAFLPMVMEIIARHQATHSGAMPTQEEIKAAFEVDIQTKADEILSKGAAWKASKGRV